MSAEKNQHNSDAKNLRESSNDLKNAQNEIQKHHRTTNRNYFNPHYNQSQTSQHSLVLQEREDVQFSYQSPTQDNQSIGESRKSTSKLQCDTPFIEFKHQPLERVEWKSEQIIIEEQEEIEKAQSQNQLTKKQSYNNELLIPEDVDLTYESVPKQLQIVQLPSVEVHTLQQPRLFEERFIQTSIRQFSKYNGQSTSVKKSTSPLQICRQIFVSISPRKKQGKRSLEKEAIFCYHVEKRREKANYLQQKGHSCFKNLAYFYCEATTIFPSKQEVIQCGNQTNYAERMSLRKTEMDVKIYPFIKQKNNVKIGTQEMIKKRVVGTQTQELSKKIKIYPQHQMSLSNQGNFEHYLEKISSNFQTLIKELLSNQQLIASRKSSSNKKLVNCGTYCNQRLLEDNKNLKRTQIEEENNSIATQSLKNIPYKASRGRKSEKQSVIQISSGLNIQELLEEESEEEAKKQKKKVSKKKKKGTSRQK